MIKILIISCCLITSPCLAQQQSPSEQALGNKLIQEIQVSLKCSTDLIILQLELEKVKLKIKELEQPKEDKK